MDKLIDILLCSYASILVFLVPILIVFGIDFTIYCLTGKCLLHKLYRIVERSL